MSSYIPHVLTVPISLGSQRAIYEIVAPLLLILVFLSICSPAAAEWVRAFENEKEVIYLDPTTIQNLENFAKALVLYDYKKLSAQNYLSEKFLYEFECRNEMLNSVYFVRYSKHMADGTVIDSAPSKEAWQPVVPKSMGEAYWKIACGKRPFSVPEHSKWQKFDEDDSATWYIAQSSIYRNAGIATMTDLIDLKGEVNFEGNFVSMSVTREYNCTEKTYKNKTAERYSGKMGGGIVEKATDGPKFSSVRPIEDAHSEKLLAIACGIE